MSNPPGYRIHIKRDRYKFSCAHMTVFPNGSKEKLHGHNYYLSLAVELATVEFASMIDFGPIKVEMAKLCGEWKEHTLLATLNPFYEVIEDTDTEIEFRLCRQRYVLPKNDVVLLPIDNIAVEPLSKWACLRLLTALEAVLRPDIVIAIEVTVEENPGQGGTTRMRIGE